MKQFQSFVALILAVVLVYMLLPVQKAEAATMKNGYKSFQDAAVYVRGELAKFSPSVQVKYYFDSPERFSTREYWELLKKEVVKHTGVSDEGDYMFWTFQQVGVYAETQIEGNTHYVDLQITPMYNNSAQQEKQLEQKLDQVMASLNLTGKTDYQKVEAIYRYICENIEYSDAVLSSGADPINPPDHLRAYYSAYGALVLKSTTCQGFSSLVYAMMLRAGIDCRLIVGDNHGWNIVKLDGKYYYLDATWDSDRVHAGKPMLYFLRGSSKFRTYGWVDGENAGESEHKTWYNQFNKEFLDQHPVSVLDYGEAALSGGVLGSGKCGDLVDWTLTGDGKLTISGTGAMWDAPAYGAIWYTGEGPKVCWDGLGGYVKQIEIQQGITAVGTRAFINFPQLTAVSIASSVETIGAYAFAMCENLKQITLPNTVKTLGDNAFYQCVRLENAVVSSGMQMIPENAFIGCTALKTVQIPSGLRQIGTSAFAVCSNLQGLQLPTSVTTLGPMAFAQAFDPEKKVSLTIPETVTQIDWNCFAESGLHQVNLKAKVNKLDSSLFNLCHYLQSVTLSDTIKTFTDNTFYKCTNLKEVTLPFGLEQLGECAFESCLSLQSIDLPDTLKTIPNNTFSKCISMKTVSLPGALEELGSGAFAGCAAIKEVVIPATLKKLGYGAFSQCVGLETLKFQGNAPGTIGGNPLAFAGTVTVYYPKDNATWTQGVKNSISVGNPEVIFVGDHGPNGPHTSGSWKPSGDVHIKTCTDCGAVMQSQAHTWDTGRITLQPNCRDTGVRTYTCTLCGGTKTETLSKTNTHTYANPCDGDCEFCAATRPVSHSYNTEWSSDEQGHYHVCSKCDGKKDMTAHTPGAEATDTIPQVCTECGFVIVPAANHTHQKVDTVLYDDAYHWYNCSGCNERLHEALHTWEDSCDTLCDECGCERDALHSYDGEWETDESNHRLLCYHCGALLDQSPHDMENGACLICNYIRQEETEKTEEFPWAVVIVAAAVAAVGAGAGVAAVIVKKKS